MSRRELNKSRTREALVAATRALAQERGLENVTAEDIADRAGVSRRTFFNYFPGIEGVVAAGLAEPLERLADELLRRPADEDPVTAIMAALRARPLGAEVLLGWDRPGSDTARHQPVRIRIWQHHEQWLITVLRRRLGGDETRIRSLAAAVMAIFESVQAAWEPAEHDSPDQAVAAFNAELLRALDHARSGWRTA